MSDSKLKCLRSLGVGLRMCLKEIISVWTGGCVLKTGKEFRCICPLKSLSNTNKIGTQRLIAGLVSVHTFIPLYFTCTFLLLTRGRNSQHI